MKLPSDAERLSLTTPEQIFEFAKRQLNLMPHRSADETFNTCLYRAPDGNACVVGRMLTDAEVENLTTQSLSVTGLARFPSFPSRLAPHVSLLQALQGVHDTECNWDESGFIGHEHLADVAPCHNL